jgi:hypothetical protein
MTGEARAALEALDDERAKSAEIGNARAMISLALVHGYTTAFWWSAAIFASGAVICGTLLRDGRGAIRAGRTAGELPGVYM